MSSDAHLNVEGTGKNPRLALKVSFIPDLHPSLPFFNNKKANTTHFLLKFY